MTYDDHIDCDKQIDKLQADNKRLREALGLDDCVIEFAKRMQYKLDKNKHKECSTMNLHNTGRKWDMCLNSWLWKRMGDEREELIQAMASGIEDDILNECADVGNFAMMIFDNTSKQALKESEEPK